MELNKKYIKFMLDNVIGSSICGKFTTKTVISRDHGKNKCDKK